MQCNFVTMLKHDTQNFEYSSYIHSPAFIKSFVLLVVKRKKNLLNIYLSSLGFFCLVVLFCLVYFGLFWIFLFVFSFVFPLCWVDLLQPAFIFTSYKLLGNRAWIRKSYSEKNNNFWGFF